MKKIFFSVISFFAPVLAFAQGAAGTYNISSNDTAVDIFFKALTFTNKILMPALVVLATLYFSWGVVKYIKGGKEGKEGEEAKALVIRGVIGLFLMIGIWGLVRFLDRSLGNPASGNAGSLGGYQVPCVPIPGSTC